MNIWIIIGIGVVAIVGVCYAIYKRKINHAREQQRLTLTQNISHELKTPVASIRGALETILMHPDMDEEQRRQFIERAYQQSGRLANLVEDISTINKLDTQTDFYTRLQLDLHTIVENVVQDLSLRATQAGATITHNIPKHLIISGNYTLLYSIFHNILDNAIKFSYENSSIYITLEDLGERLRVTIKDEGVGISEEELPNIFDKFYTRFYPTSKRPSTYKT